jgi:hypothetical protein
MTGPGGSERVYVVTDIEVDGFVPGAHSMLALASVAVTAAGEQVGEFEAVLERLPGAQANPDTWAWWLSQPPEVLAAATTDPRPVPEVMADYVAWIKGLGPERELVASPLGFDGTYVDHYLRRFTSYGLAQARTRPICSSTEQASASRASRAASPAATRPPSRSTTCRRSGSARSSTPTGPSTTRAATRTCWSRCCGARGRPD